MPTRPLEPKIENSSVTVHDIIEAFNFKITEESTLTDIGIGIQQLLSEFIGYEIGMDIPILGNVKQEYVRILNQLIDNGSITIPMVGTFTDSNIHGYGTFLTIDDELVTITFARDDINRNGSLNIGFGYPESKYVFSLNWNKEEISVDY